MISRSGAKKILEDEVGKEGKKESKIFYTANFDGLVDIVKNNNSIKFLTADKTVSEQVEVEGFTYNSPPLKSLPPNLQIPRYDEVRRYAQNHHESGDSGVSGVCRGCTLLYKKLFDYHKHISELPKESLYHLLVIWDFHTYAIEKANFSPIIYFYSVAERGKSRTLKGMINVAYRGIRKGDITDAQLIRDCTHLRATIAFDMMDFWDKVQRAGSVDVVLNRYERGTTVSRVNRPDKGAFQDTDYYDVFGPTVLATNEIIHTIADSRSIPIVMIKSDKDFEDEVIAEQALYLKEELVAFRLAHYNDEFPKVNKIVKSRLGDIVRPLHRVLMAVNPEEEDTFIKLVKEIEKIKLTERIGSTDSDIIQAYLNTQGEIVGGVLACQLIANDFNREKDEKEKLSSRRVGNRLKSFGFQPTQTNDHTLGFFKNDELINKLIKEYDLPLQTPENPETPETSDELDPDKIPF